METSEECSTITKKLTIYNMKQQALEILNEFGSKRKFKSELSKLTKLNPSTLTQIIKRQTISNPVANLILKNYKKALVLIWHRQNIV